ncbi:MFS general substrate transporter [Saitoella complicata NRRL Y-17804]|uniref:General alpha-glucoside permease n=1 Tax=Saitoella complicata (strain BCRC 22490 / CBS 7301 / JCM 7358 / NBRC 10748 / NRRL Y-17804) TaxID=698492 RepID=A0A0E9N7Y3_SAICN|nr:MFS general substrate transporter [Saitoella complicata NRRL Y-17804]ODQ54480.1 MFS general substrate transporter [Saitoella complicata NRRL Y-17804]GAO45934.1 hypothetical protein G7K_0179-t1 [Saitoella complicata NRRL Y-17804]
MTAETGPSRPYRPRDSDAPDERTSLIPHHTPSSHDQEAALGASSSVDNAPSLPTRSLGYMIVLTLVLAGLQFTWTVEMGNGTPYLISLGIPKPLMSLIWIAGPLSGMLMQPIIGLLSDTSTLSWGKRRPFIIAGTIGVVTSLLVLGWTREVVELIAGGRRSIEHEHKVRTATSILAVFMIYLLDFAINTIQASSRTLIVDSVSPQLQSSANAWGSRMIGIGNVFGYLSGYMNLPRYLPALGFTQMKVLCAIASAVLILTVAITCASIKERNPNLELQKRNQREKSGLAEVWEFASRVALSISRIPVSIERVCNVQFFAWIGWFPFLFYITTYIAEIYIKTSATPRAPVLFETLGDTISANTTVPPPPEREWEAATRAGNFAMLLFALVSLGANVLLPIIVKESSTETGEEKWWKVLTLRRAWTLSHLLFAGCMFSTYWVNGVWGTTVLVAVCGVSWALTLWAPFALISEQISLRAQAKANRLQHEDTSSGTSSTDEKEEEAAGVILGVHNFYIAAPQVISTLIASALFRILGGSGPEGRAGDDSLGWVLRVGGISTCLAAWLSLRVRNHEEQQETDEDEDN